MRANEGQVFTSTAWMAAWKWRDFPDPCEIVFASTQKECNTVMAQRVATAKQVLIRLHIARTLKQAEEYVVSSRCHRIGMFEPDLREFARDTLPVLAKKGIAVQTSPAYEKLARAARIPL